MAGCGFALKYVAVFVFAFLVAFIRFGDANAKNYGVNEIRKSNGITYDMFDQPINGKVKAYYDNGKLKSETDYKKGKAEGTVITYYENGNVFEEGAYQNGVLEGMVQTYTQDGKRASRAMYKNGKKHGSFKTYYRNGKVEKDVAYRNGVPDGVSVLYYEQGNVKGEIVFTEGVAVKAVKYDTDGNVTEVQEAKQE